MARKIIETDLQGIDVYEEPLGEGDVQDNTITSRPPYQFSNDYVPEENYTSSEINSGKFRFREFVEKVNNKGSILQSGENIVKGRFAENKINLPKFDLNSITAVPYVSFKFILKTKYKNDKTNRITTKLFTSSETYEYLANAKLRNIPYPAISILSEVVEIDINPIIDKVINLRQSELTNNVFIEKNVFLIFNDLSNEFEIDYPSLLKYIDWVVTKPSGTYDERLLPIDEISSVQVDEIEGEETTEETTEENTAETTEETTEETLYPPIGRPGQINLEIATTSDGDLYIWNSSNQSWEEETEFNGSRGDGDTNNSGGNSTGGGGGNENLPGRS